MNITVEQIVDLIRAEHRSRVGGFAISTAEAIDLIENYAACAASGAAIEVTKSAHERAMATFDKLAVPPSPHGSAE